MRNDKQFSSIHQLFTGLLSYRTGISQLIALHIIWLFIELSVPFLTRALVDRGIKNQDFNFVTLVLIAQLMLFIGYLSTDFFKSWILRHIGIRLNMRLLNQFLYRLVYKNIIFFSKQKEGDIGQLVTDNFRIEKFLTDSLSSFIDAFLKILLYAVVLAIFNIYIALIFIVSIGISLLWDFIFLKERARVDNLRFTSATQVRNELTDVIHGIQDIKVNNLEHHRTERWKNVQNIFSIARIKVLRIVQIYKGGTLVIDQIRDITIIFLAANFVMKGFVSLGELLAIQYILGQLNKQTFILMQFIQDYHDAKLSINRIASTLEANPNYTESFEKSTINSFPIQETITFDKVNFSYDNLPSLKNISFTIPYGSRIAIVGESGSGKSTLIKTLLKLLHPQKGIIKLGDRNFDNIKPEDWLNNCSIVLQEGNIFPGTLLYNITFCDHLDQVDHHLLDQAIMLSCFYEILNELKDGIQTIIGRGGKAFSKGQEQRILIARAIYKNANYLILDEPTSALDTITEKTVFTNLLHFFKNRTIIFTTHKLRMTKSIDIIMLIEKGAVAEIGNHNELVALKGKYFDFFIN